MLGTRAREKSIGNRKGACQRIEPPAGHPQNPRGATPAGPAPARRKAIYTTAREPGALTRPQSGHPPETMITAGQGEAPAPHSRPDGPWTLGADQRGGAPRLGAVTACCRPG